MAGSSAQPGMAGSPVRDTQPDLRVLWSFGWKFLNLFRRYTWRLILLSVLSSVVMVATPVMLGKVTNHIVPGDKKSKAAPDKTSAPPVTSAGPEKPNQLSFKEKQSLLFYYLLWLACAGGGIGLTVGVRYSQSVLDVSMANAIRERLFSSIIREQLEFFHANEVGRLTMLVNQVSTQAQVTFRQTVLDPLFQVVSFMMALGAIVFTFSHMDQKGDPRTLWGGVAVVLLVALLSPLAVSRMGRRLQASSSDVMSRNLAVAGLVNGSLKSPEEVQSFNAENYFAMKYRENLEKIRAASVHQTLTIETINTLSSLPTVLVQIMFLGVAIWMVCLQSAGAARPGDIVSILLLVPQLMMPIQAISNYMIMLRSTWPSVETVLGHLSDVKEQATAVLPAAANGQPEPTLEAKNLIFRYRPDLPPVFNDVSFTVPAGKITGLVAKMGQGKTTFFRLALGFYQPAQGDILLGGRPVRTQPLTELRRHVVMMSQFPAFFHDTVRDNLRIARPEASDIEIESVCRQTGVWPLLTKLGEDAEQDRFPNPLDRQFASGQMFSGGQKKLLALTRCLLRSPTFLLLDEPTAGMDNEEKYGLVADLKKACGGRTVMAVDHDIPWLLKFCDYFIVLDQGRVVQQGTGEDLVDQPGLFKELHDKTVYSSAVASANTDHTPKDFPAGRLSGMAASMGQPG